jgi:murein DD-endopeptidase MepM/ murein hydrolase activator NlpD/pimeloyl-ACP methyl ester carboxylesterase
VVYSLKVKLTDRAGNISQESTAIIQTLPCPKCVGNSTGGWVNPVHDYRVRETSTWRSNDRPDHNGLDINIGQDSNGNVIGGTPIYAAKAGTVEYSRYSYTDSDRWTPAVNSTANNPIYLDTSNYVIINNTQTGETTTTKSHYVHLQYQTTPIVTAGQVVTTDTIIGYMGKTGQATDNHLHFGVFMNGIDQDPSQPSILNTAGDTASAGQQASWCKKSGEGSLTSSQTDWLYNNKTQQPITLTFKKNIWPLSGGTLESISGEANPQITRIVKKTDTLLGVDGDIDAEAGKYTIYGIAPTKGQKLIIQFKEGNNIVETREESLQTARWRARKSCNASNGNITDEIDNATQSGRIEFQLETRWSGQVCNNITTDNKVTLQNEEWIDSYLYHSTSCFGGNCELKGTLGGNYGTNSEHKTLQNTERLLDPNTGLQSYITVTGGDSETLGSTVVHDTNTRVAMLKSAYDRQKDAYNSGNVWVISHGWNGTIGDTKKLAEEIAKDNPNDIALYLDWREISHTITPFQSATWTEATSTKVKERLNAWGFSDRTKLKLVGHSMGTILNAEIGLRFGKASYEMSLDNPGNATIGYDVNKYGKKRTSFNQTADVSHAITGTFSPAGDMQFAETAQAPFALNYSGRQTWEGDWHGFVRDTYTALQNEDQLQNDQLFSTDQSPKNDWNTFGQVGIGKTTGYGYNIKGLLEMAQTDKTSRGEVGYLKIKINNQPFTIYQK